MTGKTSPVRRKRRPQRSNSLKDIGRLLGVAAHVDRKDKLLAEAAYLNYTGLAARGNYFKIQRVNLFARELGFEFVTNDPDDEVNPDSRVFHLHEDWPGAVAQALHDDCPAGQALRHLRASCLDDGAPAPLGRQGGTQWKSGQLGGPTPQAKKLATHRKAEVNKAIVALREADPAFIAACDEQERLLAIHRALTAPLWDSPDRMAGWQELVESDA